jgi:hypothetical protein
MEARQEAQAEKLAAQWTDGSCGASEAAKAGKAVGKDGLTELETFWLRKTKKPVLAVLLVRKRGDPRVKVRAFIVVSACTAGHTLHC